MTHNGAGYPCVKCGLSPRNTIHVRRRQFGYHEYAETEKAPMQGIYISAPVDLHDRITQSATECNVSISAFCRQAIAKYLDDLDCGAA